MCTVYVILYTLDYFIAHADDGILHFNRGSGAEPLD